MYTYSCCICTADNLNMQTNLANEQKFQEQFKHAAKYGTIHRGSVGAVPTWVWDSFRPLGVF